MIALWIVTVCCIFFPVYAVVGYPPLLWMAARLFGKGAPHCDDIKPRVTMIVSCYNEAKVLPRKIDNCLSIDYPPSRLDFVFVSDASSDDTDEIVRGAANKRIRLVRQDKRQGKTKGLNLAMQSIDSQIVVFSDANAMYEPNSIRKLVRPFADESVGYVVGAALYDGSEGSASGRSESLYWNLEVWIKQQESKLYSVVGGDGAIYAIRRTLFWPFDREDINDLVNPLQIVSAGYRGAFERAAVCFEHPAGDFAKEGRRKRRIVNRSFTAITKNKHLLNPFRFRWFSFCLVSHKLLRWMLAPFIVVGIGGVLVLGLAGDEFFRWLLPPVLGFVWLALAGYLLRRQDWQPIPTALAYYVFVVAYSASLGIVDALRGSVTVIWDPPRSDQLADQRQLLLQGLAAVGLAVTSVCLFLSVRVLVELTR